MEVLYDQKRKGKYISQMTTEHIENTIKWLKRNKSEGACKWFQRELYLRNIGQHLPKSDRQKFLESLGGIETKQHDLEKF